MDFKKFGTTFRGGSGFTLIELMVVISIAAILIALGTVSYGTAQRKARDAKRRGDMKAVSNAFEQYYADNGAYGTLTDMSVATYLPGGLPSDPKPTFSYHIVSNSVTNRYCACGEMETDDGNGNLPGAGSPATCDFNPSGGYFCVTSLQ